ncbi:MAG: nucleotide sugar dehydrogenase [Acidobacteriaceae bacterium]
MGDASVKIVVVGSGYVGLVASACFAEIGHPVVCVDKDQQKIAALRHGVLTIHERLLPELVQRHQHRLLRFTTDLAGAVQEAEVVFIAVGTPQTEDGRADLSYVESVTREIARSIRRYTVIAEKSTVPVYTNEWVRHLLEQEGVPSAQFDVVSNPEFLREGTAVVDFLHPDRILVGAESARAAGVLQRVYAPLTSGAYYDAPGSVPGQCTSLAAPPLLLTSAKSAELIKHASNAFLAMKISFINQVSNVCEAAGASVHEVVRGVGLDRRIGLQFLKPGIGYGGSCFPKDVAAFRAVAAALGVDFDLLTAVEKTNIEQRERFFEKVCAALGPLKGKRLAVLGLAFKGGTDDVRESPAMALVQKFLDAGCSVAAFDPAAMPQAQATLAANGRLRYAEDAYAAAADADALLILTDWPQFGALDWERIRKKLAHPLVLDGRNLCLPEEVTGHGLMYACIGRAGVLPAQAQAQPGPSQEGQPQAASAVRTGKPAVRVLLTGAAGFLGSHLAVRLVAEGHPVLGVDNLSTGDLRNLSPLRKEPRFEFLEQDISTPFDPGKVDYIFNFACPASPVQYLRLGPETLRVGSEGTRRMLELARRHGAKFLHASTSECYGTPLLHPQPESYWGNVNPVGPRSVYDEAKRFGEALVMAYHRYYRVDTRLVRIFNTYGPQMQPDDGRVISNFIVQALAGKDLTVYGDGSQTRSFCYISDMVEGILRLSRVQEALPVNLGNPDELTVLACAQQVIASCQSPSKIIFGPLPEDDPLQRQPEITKARRLLDWGPTVSLQQGLQETIPYFRSLLAKDQPVA